MGVGRRTLNDENLIRLLSEMEPIYCLDMILKKALESYLKELDVLQKKLKSEIKLDAFNDSQSVDFGNTRIISSLLKIFKSTMEENLGEFNYKSIYDQKHNMINEKALVNNSYEIKKLIKKIETHTKKNHLRGKKALLMIKRRK